MAGDVFDYVIVGAGSAGSLLASRLTEDGSTTVCVLESGPPDWNPYIHIPAGFMKTLLDPKVTWQFLTEPTQWTGGRPIRTVQGRTLGGGSSINGHIYNRGQRADFDGWAQRGNRGWGYADVLPYFKRTQKRIGPGDDTFHGRDGNLLVTDLDWRHPICEAFIAGAVGLGIPHNPDYNGARQEGVAYCQRAIHRGRRVSAARAFLHPARKRPVLDVRTHAQATAILFEDKRAIGVRYADDRTRGPERTVTARREVILCGGSANTPKLLQISGVGPAELLGQLGVPVVHHLPGVGENLQDHYAARMVARVKNSDTVNDRARGPRLLGEIAKWMVGLPSILTLSPSLIYLFWKSDEVLDAADLQVAFVPASYKEGAVGILDDYPGMTCGVWQHRPESVGYVRARSTDPFEPPIIQPNYLDHETDRRKLLAGMRLTRRLLEAPQLAPYYDHEALPGKHVRSDDELLGFAKAYGSTTFHLVGTCKMGPASDPTAVVDDQLRVHGLENLRVVNAAVMPRMPSANTNASTLMIAEKAADMIRGRAPLPAAALAA